MEAGLLKLFDMLAEWRDLLSPFFIFKTYECGVVLRWGKWNRTCGPGLHFKWPIAEDTMKEVVVTTTLNGSAQSITTMDGKNIVVSAIVKYRIADVKTFILEVYDVRDALQDILLAETKAVIAESTWDDCTRNDIDDTITIRVRDEATKWGLAVDRVTLVDLAPIRSIRLINSQQ